MRVIIGIWCGAGSALLADIHGTPLLKLTYARAPARTGIETRFLVPWYPDLDHMELEIKSWKPAAQPVRCHPDTRVAMRDLVAKWDAEIGMLIDGGCSVIDSSEIFLAIRRCSGDWHKYKSPRIDAKTAAEWLGFEDSDEWVPPMDPQASRQFYTLADMHHEARMLKARKSPRG